MMYDHIISLIGGFVHDVGPHHFTNRGGFVHDV